MAFDIHNTLSAGAGVVEELLAAPSTLFKLGDMLNVANGIASRVTAAGKATHLLIAPHPFDSTNRPVTLDSSQQFTTSAALGDKIQAVRVDNGQVITKSKLTGTSAPLVNGTAANANAVVSQVVFDAAGIANGALVGGTVFVPGLGHARITGDTKVSNTHTLDIHPSFRRAATTGDTVFAVPFSKGLTTVKFDATTPSQGIGTAVADASGGNNKIEDVDLLNLYVYTSHPDAE